MNLDQLAELPGEVLTAAQVAPLLQTNPDTLRRTAREYPGLLGFPVICMGNRVLIPKRPFISFMGGKA